MVVEEDAITLLAKDLKKDGYFFPTPDPFICWATIKIEQRMKKHNSFDIALRYFNYIPISLYPDFKDKNVLGIFSSFFVFYSLLLIEILFFSRISSDPLSFLFFSKNYQNKIFWWHLQYLSFFLKND